MANIYDMSDTWNDSGTTFTAIKMDVTDTDSASDSLLMDLQVDGTSKFSVDKGGNLTITPDGSGSGSGLIFGNFGGTTGIRQYGTGKLGVDLNGTAKVAIVGDSVIGLQVDSDMVIGWAGPSVGVPSDLRLYRDAADSLAQKRGANAQTYNIYNTDDGTNYERLRIGWDANVMEIKPEAAGTGTTRELHISGLPTADPGPGILWNDAGTVKVGT